jgi:hypothetical protein
MVLKIITPLLILLSLSSQLDDIQAAATPERDDDLLAAQDNDYLVAVKDDGTKTEPNNEVPAHNGQNASVNDPSKFTAVLAQRDPLLSYFLNPLYVLMSFQC